MVYIGRGLALLCVAYIVSVLVQSDISSYRSRFDATMVVRLVLAGTLSVVFVAVSALSWILVLRFLTGGAIGLQQLLPLVKAYFQSNIAKYVPGSIMHLVGRNVLAARLGASQVEIALSSFLDYSLAATCTAVCAGALLVFGVVPLPPAVSFRPSVSMLAGAAAALLGVSLLIAAVLIRKRTTRGPLPEWLWTLSLVKNRFRSLAALRLVVLVSTMVMLNTLLSVIYSVWVCQMVLEFKIALADFWIWYLALSISAFSNVLTPGVPGGIGVRESVTAVILSQYGYPRADVLVASMVLRVALVIGDGVSFVIGTILPGRSAASGVEAKLPSPGCGSTATSARTGTHGAPGECQ